MKSSSDPEARRERDKEGTRRTREGNGVVERIESECVTKTMIFSTTLQYPTNPTIRSCRRKPRETIRRLLHHLVTAIEDQPRTAIVPSSSFRDAWQVLGSEGGHSSWSETEAEVFEVLGWETHLRVLEEGLQRCCRRVWKS